MTLDLSIRLASLLLRYHYVNRIEKNKFWILDEWILMHHVTIRTANSRQSTYYIHYTLHTFTKNRNQWFHIYYRSKGNTFTSHHAAILNVFFTFSPSFCTHFSTLSLQSGFKKYQNRLNLFNGFNSSHKNTLFVLWLFFKFTKTSENPKKSRFHKHTHSHCHLQWKSSFCS